MPDDNPQSDPPLKQPFGFDDALFLALVTATTYLIAYSFERSYCQYFALPLDLVRISTEALLSSFVGLSAFIWTSFYLINLAASLILDPRIKRGSFAFFLLAVNTGFLGLGIILGNAGGYTWDGVRIYVLWVVGFQLVSFVFVMVMLYFEHLFSKAAGKSLLETLSPPQKLDAFKWVAQRVGRRYMVVPVAIMMLYGLAGFAGRQAATFKRSFPLIGSLKLLVIRRYNDTFVCKPLKLNPEGIGSGVTLLGLDEFKGNSVYLYKFKAQPILDEKAMGYSQ